MTWTTETQFCREEALHSRPQRQDLPLPRRQRLRPGRRKTGREGSPTFADDEPSPRQAQRNFQVPMLKAFSSMSYESHLTFTSSVTVTMNVLALQGDQNIFKSAQLFEK